MTQILFVLISLGLLFPGIHGATPTPSLFPQITLGMIHTAVTHHGTIQDNNGNTWQVRSTLPVTPTPLQNCEHIELTPLNRAPVILSHKTQDFFQDCSDMITDQKHTNETIYIGFKFLYPLPIHVLLGDESRIYYTYLIQRIPISKASTYRNLPNLKEIEMAFMFESNRQLLAQLDWIKEMRTTSAKRLGLLVIACFTAGVSNQMLMDLFSTWIPLVFIYPALFILQRFFFPMDPFATHPKN